MLRGSEGPRPPRGHHLDHNCILLPTATTLSDTREASDGPSASVGLQNSIDEHRTKLEDEIEDEIERAQSPPPQYPLSEASSSSPPPSPRPPPFSSLYASTVEAVEAYKQAVTEAGAPASVPAYAPLAPEVGDDQGSPELHSDALAETKAALPQDTQGESSKKDEDSEPPPAYSEGSSPLESFTYLMASAGGPASIITQVQQGGPPVNTLGGKSRLLFCIAYRLT